MKRFLVALVALVGLVGAASAQKAEIQLGYGGWMPPTATTAGAE